MAGVKGLYTHDISEESDINTREWPTEHPHTGEIKFWEQGLRLCKVDRNSCGISSLQSIQSKEIMSIEIQWMTPSALEVFYNA
jgi:hypothetical protein